MWALKLCNKKQNAKLVTCVQERNTQLLNLVHLKFDLNSY